MDKSNRIPPMYLVAYVEIAAGFPLHVPYLIPLPTYSRKNIFSEGEALNDVKPESKRNTQATIDSKVQLIATEKSALWLPLSTYFQEWGYQEVILQDWHRH